MSGGPEVGRNVMCLQTWKITVAATEGEGEGPTRDEVGKEGKDQIRRTNQAIYRIKIRTMESHWRVVYSREIIGLMILKDFSDFCIQRRLENYRSRET